MTRSAGGTSVPRDGLKNAICGMTPNAAVQRPREKVSSAPHVHSEMARLLRARDDVSRSAPTACYAAAAGSLLRFATESFQLPREHTTIKSQRVPTCAAAKVGRSPDGYDVVRYGD